MKLLRTDIEDLDKIIYALSKTDIATVPEILYWNQEFPPSLSQEDSDCRHYEDVLTVNRICAVTASWTPNSVPGGYKMLYLERAGFEIVRAKESIKDFLVQKERDGKPPVSTINITQGANSNIVQESRFRDLKSQSPINTISQQPNATPAPNPIKTSGHTIWDKIKYISAIVGAAGATIAATVAVFKAVGWLG